MLLSPPQQSPSSSPLPSDDDEDDALYYVEGNPSPQRRPSHVARLRRAQSNSVDSLVVSHAALTSTASDVPHLSEGYGFVGAFSSGIAGLAYVAWALVPQDFLETWLSFRSAPSQYWAIALPVFAMGAVCFFTAITLAFQLLRTPALHEKCTYSDRHSMECSEYTRDQSSLGTPPFMDIPIVLLSQIQSGTGAGGVVNNGHHGMMTKATKSRKSHPRSRSRATIEAEKELSTVSSRSTMLPSPPILTSNPSDMASVPKRVISGTASSTSTSPTSTSSPSPPPSSPPHTPVPPLPLPPNFVLLPSLLLLLLPTTTKMVQATLR